jgi:chromosome segregation protein
VRFLKQLQLHGYKTFAARTEFVFDEGITAIVGPNGSGKSNLADALRWVLGEQSYTTLRGKRTEDMIFAGSEQRPRLGMAHVSLTFDNSSGWLPIAFNEVEIGRRAYRSGENEYYLNSNRVRLRDITELLGGSGLSERTYTVIGQGLIDQALSQRPDERRKLFEEAAGITVHQSKREQALNQLAEARANLTRAQDIISELTPRLRYLKGQARRTQEYQQIKADLDAQLRLWYGFKWGQALRTLVAGKARLADCIRAAEGQADALSALVEQIAICRAERAALRDQIGEWHRVSSQLHRQAEAAQRELAVRSEQHRLLGAQREELQRELTYLQAVVEDGAERLRTAEATLAEAVATHEAHATLVTTAQSNLEAREQERQALAQKVAQAQDTALALKAQLAERRARSAQLTERRAELARVEAEQRRAAQAAAAQLSDLETQLAALEAKNATAQAELARLEQARQAQAQTVAAAQAAEHQAAEQLSTAQRALTRLQDQHAMLVRQRDEGERLSPGVRAVLAAARRPSPSLHLRETGQGVVSGIIGTLGDLIEVPSDLEKAIEAALGGRLQDIVVQHWEDAEAAVAFLKQRQAGRATFLPLDSLHPGRAVDVPRLPGVVGLASTLVKFDPAIRPAVELALNRTLIVQDLPIARRVLSQSRQATLVTLEGDIVRPGGSVTGGSERSRRDGAPFPYGDLRLARALRELPAQIQAAAAQVTEHEAQVAQARADQEAARAVLDTLRAARQELVPQSERLAAELNRLELAAERARQMHTWHEERRQQAFKEMNGLDTREAELRADIAALAEQNAAQEAAVETARRELAQLATDDLVAELARQRTEAAVSAGQRQSYQARVDELRTLQQERLGEVAAKERRAEELAVQQAEARQVIDRQESMAQALADRIAALACQIDPAEARLAQLEQEQRAAEAQERTRREHARTAQMRQSQAELAVQRSQDELTHLRAEITKELGLVALEGDEAVDTQPPLPLNGVVVPLPVVDELPEGLERDVRALRGQISRLGPVNLDAPAEYAEAEARHNFLTAQVADLEKAVASLEEVIAELDRVMEREFLATFRAIAGQFRQEFTNLFGGGSARLVLTDPDSPATTGVEIIARPPGKREQGLALLSGGERALTAAALIFSILKVRPTPFCVLDEVDAALDEANIGRFRDVLRTLSKQTQFIVITHNRGTIETADTIYGISMGADNTSQALSLKLEGQEVGRDPREIGGTRGNS